MKKLIHFLRSVDGVDWTPAFNRAVLAAAPLGEPILFPSGWLQFMSRPDPMGAPITIAGETGPTSSKLGTCVVPMYNESDPEAGHFTWNGSDPRGFRGSGGGIRNLTMYRVGGPSGGTAIKVVSPNSLDFRAGWWSLSNVAVLAESGSTWDRVFLGDGSAVENPGSEGVRVLFIRDFMASSAIGRTIEFRNIVHGMCSNLQVQGGPTVATTETSLVGMLITGNHSQDIHMSNTTIYGTLEYEKCETFSFMGGYAKWLKLGVKEKVKRGIIHTGCDLVTLAEAQINVYDRINLLTV